MFPGRAAMEVTMNAHEPVDIPRVAQGPAAKGSAPDHPANGWRATTPDAPLAGREPAETRLQRFLTALRQALAPWHT
jgi:hypothetical protein